MTEEIVVSAKNLTKKYNLYDKPIDRLKESLHPLRRKYHRDFYALSDVSFDIRKGETVGVIGRNGAGKSTLLKIITGVVTPTSGILEIKGKISSLLELGAGFNPDMTGIENIYMNGTIMGYTTAEIDKKLDSILAFADIGEFVYQQVKMYSSGMFARLAFAVAISVKPDILIVDEALSVGDMTFQAKCITAMARVKEEGTTVIFVSHDIDSIKSFCDTAMYLERGRIIAYGKAGTVAARYIKEVREEGNSLDFPALSTEQEDSEKSIDEVLSKNINFKHKNYEFRYGTGDIKIDCVEMLNDRGFVIENADFDQHVCLRIYFTSSVESLISVNYYIQDEKKNLILGSCPRQADNSLINVEHGKYIVEYRTRLPLMEGAYSIQAQITKPTSIETSAVFLDVVEDSIVFKINKKMPFKIWSKVFVPNEFKMMKYLD